jgi:hypothetical protein
MTMQRIISPWPEDGFSRASRRMALLYHPRRAAEKDKKKEQEGTKSIFTRRVRVERIGNALFWRREAVCQGCN